MKDFLKNNLIWTREPKNKTITENTVEIITDSNTDLWQRTYYGFKNDNAPILQIETEEKYFSFIVKTQFESKNRFDQCGIAMSPEKSSFKATFSNMMITECQWDSHK